MARTAKADHETSQEIDIRLSVPSAWGATVRKWLAIFAVGGVGAGSTGLVVANTGNTQAAESVEVARQNATELAAIKAALPQPKAQADIEAAAARTAARDAKLDGLVTTVDDLRKDVREIRGWLRRPDGSAASPPTHH